MCQKYHPKLKFNDYLTAEYHGRTGVYMTTDDCQVLLKKLNDGWTYVPIKEGFWVRAPDISLVDITDPFKLNNFNDNVIYFALFNYLKKLKESNQLYSEIKQITKAYPQFKGLLFYISEGSSLEAEIRIGGSDKRINDLKNKLINDILIKKEFSEYIKSAKEYLGETRNISISKLNETILDKNSLLLVKNLNMLNQSVLSHNMNSQKKELNPNIINNIYPNLPNNDVLIFIPTGCYQYISSFIQKNTSEKIMLWEVHNNKDANHSSKYLVKDIKNKKCLIFDKSYTGKTLNMIAKLVKDNGGEPIKLALFPKSRTAIKNADYVMILDRVFKSDNLKLNKNWTNMYFKEILNIN